MDLKAEPVGNHFFKKHLIIIMEEGISETETERERGGGGCQLITLICQGLRTVNGAAETLSENLTQQ